MKEIMFSTFFQSSHPRKGDPTFFIEKIIKGLDGNGEVDPFVKKMVIVSPITQCFAPKYHTIRKGNNFKIGDHVNFKVWSGKPYQSKKVIFARNVEIKQTWEFEMDDNGVYAINGKYLDTPNYLVLSQNDGLTEEDMFFWFMPDYSKPKEFKGQIICWNNFVNYP